MTQLDSMTQSSEERWSGFGQGTKPIQVIFKAEAACSNPVLSSDCNLKPCRPWKHPPQKRFLVSTSSAKQCGQKLKEDMRHMQNVIYIDLYQYEHIIHNIATNVAVYDPARFKQHDWSENSCELDGISTNMMGELCPATIKQCGFQFAVPSTVSSFADRRSGGRCGSHHEVQRYKGYKFKGQARQHITEITSQDIRSAPKTETFGTLNKAFDGNGLLIVDVQARNRIKTASNQSKQPRAHWFPRWFSWNSFSVTLSPTSSLSKSHCTRPSLCQSKLCHFCIGSVPIQNVKQRAATIRAEVKKRPRLCLTRPMKLRTWADRKGVSKASHILTGKKPTGPDDLSAVHWLAASFNLNFNYCNTGSKRTFLQNLTNHDPRIRQVGNQCIQKLRCMSTCFVLIQAVQAAGLISWFNK